MMEKGASMRIRIPSTSSKATLSVEVGRSRRRWRRVCSRCGGGRGEEEEEEEEKMEAEVEKMVPLKSARRKECHCGTVCAWADGRE